MSKASGEKVPTVPGLGNVHDGESAVREVEKEALALPIERVAVPNFDVSAAVFMVGTVKPRIDYLRDVIRRRAPDVDIKTVDRIGTLALAAWHVSTAGRIESSKSDTPALYDKAEKLLGDLEAAEVFLVRRNALPADDIEKLKPKSGDRQSKAWLVDSLEKHIEVWRRNWDTIEQYNLLPKSEIDEGAHVLAQIMMPAKSPDAEAAKETDFRYRVVSLFVAGWEEVRRAVRHVRWYDGDFDVIAPTLRQHSGHRNPSDSGKGADATPPPALVATTTEVGSGAPKAVPPPSDGRVITGDTEPFKK